MWRIFMLRIVIKSYGSVDIEELRSSKLNAIKESVMKRTGQNDLKNIIVSKIESSWLTQINKVGLTTLDEIFACIEVIINKRYRNDLLYRSQAFTAYDLNNLVSSDGIDYKEENKMKGNANGQLKLSIGRHDVKPDAEGEGYIPNVSVVDYGGKIPKYRIKLGEGTYYFILK